VYALVKGIEQQDSWPSSRKSSNSVREQDDSLELLHEQHSDNASVYSEMSMDEDEAAKANADLLKTLKMEDKFNSQNMAPFAPGLHWTRTPNLEGDLMLEFERKDEERGIRTTLRNRPVSASLGSGTSSRPSTAESKNSEAAAKLAMLRGEFHVRLTVIEGRDLRGRPRNIAPSACLDVSWLPARQHREPAYVHERTRIIRGSTAPNWNLSYDFDVDPDGPDNWSVLSLIVRYRGPALPVHIDHAVFM